MMAPDVPTASSAGKPGSRRAISGRNASSMCQGCGRINQRRAPLDHRA